MNNEEFTPGPWVFDGEVVRTKNGDPIHNDHVTKKEGIANANLIAAAPDMYGALCRFVRRFNNGTLSISDRTKAEKAIAKANPSK